MPRRRSTHRPRRRYSRVLIGHRTCRVLDLELPDHITIQLTLFDPPPPRTGGSGRRAVWCGL